MKDYNFSLLSISPIDGRYKNQTEALSQYFSEFALIKCRVEIEIQYLIALSKIGIIRKLKKTEIDFLDKLILNFSLTEAEKIKEIESKTHHDVKAVEYYLNEKIIYSSLKDLTNFIHFGLTSEDINNIAYRISLKSSLKQTVLPEIKVLNSYILGLSKSYKSLPMLARTHGQPALPTTLGKEFLVFYERLSKEIKFLENTKFYAKLNGAVGNYNALYFAFPKTNWKKFSKNFISGFGLETNLITTQIAPYEDIIYFYQTLQRINGILLDFNQDMWRYISDGYFVQENVTGEIGSSTMPQKINPINFENSEGNIIIANSLIEGFTAKLPLSRLQRDLSGSTISRNFGVVLAHCLLSYQNCFEGLKRINPNKEKITEDLNADWSILSEAIQIYLKKIGAKDGYEIVKNFTRGQKLSYQDFHNMIDNLPLNNNQKSDLKKLTPQNYIGLTPELTKETVEKLENKSKIYVQKLELS
jgi:adenylosuccinate lyase